MNKKKFFLKILMTILINFIIVGCFSINVLAEETRGKTVLIDPGHGGIDGGAVSKKGTVEKNINLNISLKLRDRLSNGGYNVIMTREEDKGLYSDKGTIRNKKNEDLAERCRMKETSNCDLFISIHLNAFPQTQFSGAQVWYSNEESSKKFAHILQGNLRKDLDINNKRIEKPAMNEYKILRCSKVPSAIVECGFLSNEGEEFKLKADEYQDKIAESLAKSINEYFQNN